MDKPAITVSFVRGPFGGTRLAVEDDIYIEVVRKKSYMIGSHVSEYTRPELDRGLYRIERDAQGDPTGVAYWAGWNADGEDS